MLPHFRVTFDLLQPFVLPNLRWQVCQILHSPEHFRTHIDELANVGLIPCKAQSRNLTDSTSD